MSSPFITTAIANTTTDIVAVVLAKSVVLAVVAELALALALVV